MTERKPKSLEQWHEPMQWQQQQYDRQEEIRLRREEVDILKAEFELKQSMSRGWKWWMTAVIAAIGWMVSVGVIVYTIKSTVKIEDMKRVNQLADDQRKDVLAASLEHRQALLKAISLVHDLTKQFPLTWRQPSREIFDVYLTRLQESYLDITAAYQKLYVLEPDVAAELDRPFRDLDAIVNKVSTFYTSEGYEPNTLSFRWILVNCQLEEINVTSSFDKIMPYIRKPGTGDVPLRPEARKGPPRDCVLYSRNYVSFKSEEALVRH